MAESDAILARRQQLGRLSTQGKRIGYLLFAIAVVVFVIGFFSSFSSAVVLIVTLAIVVGSVVLAPSLVMSYGVKAADRQDRQDRQAQQNRQDQQDHHAA